MFLMLFMGRHPFAGRYLGPDQMPIPRAIKECRFAYGARRAGALMEQPPVAIVGDEVAFLFERAFAREMIAGGRPAPRDWIDGLSRLEKTLKQCSANPSHWHRNDTACPWCPMEDATGATLFPIISDVGATATLNIDLIWRQVEALVHPGPPPKSTFPSFRRPTPPNPSNRPISTAKSSRA
jgi:DNA-binding helix-hairpin-helix protein with protein kinase domain